MKPIFFFGALLFLSCQTPVANQDNVSFASLDFQKLDTATFAGGCFWCVEASFEQIKGVEAAISGYSGGKASTAKYKLVSYGETKHAEAVQVFYDPQVIDFNTLLDIFFTAHDPTQVNRQGPDVGTQYRSAIFYHNEEQKRLSEEKFAELQPELGKPIATELTPYKAFYKAEEYHQDFEKKNPYQSYVLNVSKPKIDRVARKFSHLLKDEEK
ncbi:MAG: peptide-methionine (S)-S-oxide reductase MsrA [Bacteroidota bacterium]